MLTAAAIPKTQPSAPARSARAEVRNPLLALTSASSLLQAPQRDRWLLAHALGQFRAECAQRAQELWRARQPDAAATFKAASVYAGHIRRLATHRMAHAPSMSQKVAVPATHTGHASVRDQRRRRDTLHDVTGRTLGALSPAASNLLSAVLSELSAHARQCAQESWKRHKAPMAAYHMAVSGYARRLSLRLRTQNVVTP